ncbi:MAG TPA: photosystem P840 reaction-center cytochrome c-551 [Bryobacteraceae bacterium]|nr:photosystem P840 reaction-center cytochrome c-551 [Bryobacteraceae bacterium]
MLTPSTSVALGLGFVVLGGLNVWLVLEAWARVKTSSASSRMLALHRIGGYLFIAIFCVMAFFMVARLRGGAENSATVTIHLTLAMLLSPLLFIKVLVARYYRTQHNLLMPLGLAIFVLSFVLIASTAGPYLVRSSRVERVSIGPARNQTAMIDLNRASDLMQRRCSKCHNLDRVVGARKDADGWRNTVDRMRAIASAGISETEAQTIILYLASQNRPNGSEQTAKMAVARALVDQRCGRCHTLDRVYKTIKTPDEWRATVGRMAEYAAGSAGALQPGEDRQIIEYLALAQTPEAADKRKTEAEAALSQRSSIPANTAAAPVPAPASPYDAKTIGFTSLICLAAAGLGLRRPKGRAVATATSAAPFAKAAPAPRQVSSDPFLVQLVQITQQTPDSKTLRFAVHGERTLNALPGQFVTFSFLFDGKREKRCYSICSSAARSGYIEITPKRVPNGCVSVFLNDRAELGMTFEATGPFGQFCLNPAADRKVVMIAAGSGITPMAGMLSYVEDLCLETDVILLYFVKTQEDIMFKREFERWEGRSKNFQYHVVLSNPEPDWKGACGRINPEFVRDTIPDIDGRAFFLCGPPAFMDAARKILEDIGVAEQRIRQEAFGGASAQPKPALPAATHSEFAIEFSRSGKTSTISEGQSLLEAAADAGVDIPSACRQGQCGTCKTRLLEGSVHMTTETGLDAESRARGYVLTCVGHATGPVRLDA